MTMFEVGPFVGEREGELDGNSVGNRVGFDDVGIDGFTVGCKLVG